MTLYADHLNGRHRERRHPQCPSCLHVHPVPEWIKRAQERRLPVKVWPIGAPR